MSYKLRKLFASNTRKSLISLLLHFPIFTAVAVRGEISKDCVAHPIELQLTMNE